MLPRKMCKLSRKNTRVPRKRFKQLPNDKVHNLTSMLFLFLVHVNKCEYPLILIVGESRAYSLSKFVSKIIV